MCYPPASLVLEKLYTLGLHEICLLAYSMCCVEQKSVLYDRSFQS